DGMGSRASWMFLLSGSPGCKRARANRRAGGWMGVDFAATHPRADDSKSVASDRFAAGGKAENSVLCVNPAAATREFQNHWRILAASKHAYVPPVRMAHRQSDATAKIL